MVLFTLLFYGIFARFREQACTFICPYGRFQSVLLDENSIVVAYDHKRGEPRAKPQRGPVAAENARPRALGDCVDCGLCVQVCPTGIDIRNGTQMECVNCTACIDACDSVM
jgi:polyferredoxin